MPSQHKLLIEYFYKWEAEQPDSVFLKQPFGDIYKDFTWHEAGQQARRIATYLRSLGLPQGSHIGLVSKNCAEWIIADLAITMAGLVSVPFYPTLTAEQINQVLTHSGCKICFVGKLDDWQGMKAGFPSDVHCISFPTYNPDSQHVQWNDILEKHEPQTENFVPNADDIFTIIYTSGTTGNPKGVLLTHNAIGTLVYTARHVLKIDEPGNRFFSFLPLNHIAERNIVEAACILGGGVMYFTESLNTFVQNLAAAQPTHFFAVPRIWDKLQSGVLTKMSQEKLDLLLKIPILNGLVKKKIRAGLGLNNTRLVMTAAAPMPVPLIQWFRRLGIVIQEAYGMTENAGAVSLMPKDAVKDGTVGRLHPTVEVKIAEGSGEILMRAAWNMNGYYNEPKMTADTIKNDWLHTGDVGELDDEGYLKITGRVKEMYKTSKGEYVSPAQIEFGFSGNKLIEQVCVVGESLPQPIALVVLAETAKNLPKASIEENLESTLKALNPTLKTYERIKKIIVMNESWTVENNMLTPTLKTKRGVIEKKYNSDFQNWFDSAGSVVWA